MSGIARAIAARQQGDDAQARWFFIQCLRMFDERSPVASVELEQGALRWFDDVVTHHVPGARSVRRAMDAHQIKFHVTGDGALSLAALADPDFMNSTKSLIERIVEAYRSCRGDADLVFLTTWGVRPDDPLAKMVETGRDGSLRLDHLFDGKQKSLAAEARGLLAQAAHIEESELREALDRFRIVQMPALPFLRGMLDDKLARHGFRAVGDEVLSNPYDDLGRKLVALPNRRFNRDAFAALMREEGFIDDGAHGIGPVHVGVRSFVRQAEYLDEFTDLLDLLDGFEERRLRTDASWDGVRDRTIAFIREVDDRRLDRIEMHLSCHISIAYAAGHAISPKSGTGYVVHQFGQGGTANWNLMTRRAGAPDDFWSVRSIHLRTDAPDVAVAVGLTNEVESDVRIYVEQHAPSVGRILVLEPVGGPSRTAVQDGSHAAALAETFDQLVARERSDDERLAMLHLFVAAPNAFTFALGRAARRIARMTLYEYDFDRKTSGGYSPSIVLTP